MLYSLDFTVKEKADGMSAQLETGNHLGSMDAMDHINRFVFYEYAWIH